jgi:head-tail adaptor
VSGDRIDPVDLTREFGVWRTTRADDGQGGYDEVVAEVATVSAKVNQPTAQEQVIAQREGVELQYALHCLPDVDVRPDDELRDDDETFRVVAAYRPSEPVYLRLTCTRWQTREDTP